MLKLKKLCKRIKSGSRRSEMKRALRTLELEEFIGDINDNDYKKCLLNTVVIARALVEASICKIFARDFAGDSNIRISPSSFAKCLSLLITSCKHRISL